MIEEERVESETFNAETVSIMETTLTIPCMAPHLLTWNSIHQMLLINIF